VGYEGCAKALKRLDYLKDLHHITTPTLFIGGAEDMAAPPEASNGRSNPGREILDYCRRRASFKY